MWAVAALHVTLYREGALPAAQRYVRNWLIAVDRVQQAWSAGIYMMALNANVAQQDNVIAAL